MENKKAPLRGAFLVRVTGLDYLGCASYGVAAVKPSASNTPPGCCIWIGSSPYLITKQKGEAKASPFYLVRIVGLEPTRRWHRNLNPTRLPIPSYPHILLRQCRNQGGLPVAVPDIFVGAKAPSSSVDRGHSLTSLHPPQAALGSLPNSTTPAFGGILSRTNGLVNEKGGWVRGHIGLFFVK